MVTFYMEGVLGQQITTILFGLKHQAFLLNWTLKVLYKVAYKGIKSPP